MGKGTVLRENSARMDNLRFDCFVFTAISGVKMLHVHCNFVTSVLYVFKISVDRHCGTDQNVLAYEIIVFLSFCRTRYTHAHT